MEKIYIISDRRYWWIVDKDEFHDIYDDFFRKYPTSMPLQKTQRQKGFSHAVLRPYSAMDVPEIVSFHKSYKTAMDSLNKHQIPKNKYVCPNCGGGGAQACGVVHGIIQTCNCSWCDGKGLVTRKEAEDWANRMAENMKEHDVYSDEDKQLVYDIQSGDYFRPGYLEKKYDPEGWHGALR